MATKEDYELLAYKLDSEGFDYCLCEYSSWEEIDDEKFQKLLKEYQKSRADLDTYLSEMFYREGIDII